MTKGNKKDRRQFIKNVSIASLTLGLMPKTLLANEQSTTQTLACDQTTLDYYGVGPFYSENPPVINDGQLAKSTEAGQRLIISGRVMNMECTEVIADALIDVWQANHDGAYDNTGFNLRGKFSTNKQGFYIFETVKPGKYLNGSKYRPSHLHFKITPPGKSTLVTQLYFEGDTDIADDAAASIKTGTYDASNRIIALTENSEGKMEGTWDIVLDAKGTSIGTNDLHLEKGIIYSAGPNPFSNELAINYGVFNKSRVGLMIYDIQGHLVANIEDQERISAKYEAVWQVPESLAKGYYFVALKVNDIQVHYLKVLHQ